MLGTPNRCSWENLWRRRRTGQSGVEGGTWSRLNWMFGPRLSLEHHSLGESFSYNDKSCCVSCWCGWCLAGPNFYLLGCTERNRLQFLVQSDLTPPRDSGCLVPPNADGWFWSVFESYRMCQLHRWPIVEITMRSCACFSVLMGGLVAGQIIFALLLQRMDSAAERLRTTP